MTLIFFFEFEIFNERLPVGFPGKRCPILKDEIAISVSRSLHLQDHLPANFQVGLLTVNTSI